MIDEKEIIKQYLNNYVLTGKIKNGYDFLIENNSKYAKKLRRLFEYKNYWYLNKEPEIIKNVVKIYHEYFYDVFWLELSSFDAINNLIRKLNSLLNTNYSNINDIELYLEEYLKSFGFFFMCSDLCTYRNPYLWKKNEIVKYNVEFKQLPLITKEITLDINFLSFFYLKGWLDYVSLQMIKVRIFQANNKLYLFKKYFYKQIKQPSFQILLLKYYAFKQYLSNDYKEELKEEDIEYKALLVLLYYYPNISLFKKYISYKQNKIMQKIVFEFNNIHFGKQVCKKAWYGLVKEVKKIAYDLLME